MQLWISSSLFLVESLKLFIKFFLDFEMNIIVGLVSNFINFFGLVRVKVSRFYQKLHIYQQRIPRCFHNYFCFPLF
jgi:hypothetical protein